jgi:hypothetical protein
MSTTRYLSISEAAFVSGLTERELNRVADKQLVPDELIVQSKMLGIFQPWALFLQSFTLNRHKS